MNEFCADRQYTHNESGRLVTVILVSRMNVEGIWIPAITYQCDDNRDMYTRRQEEFKTKFTVK